MIPFGKSEVARNFDAISVKNGIPSMILMENASFSLFEETKKMLEEFSFDKIVLFAGSGGNGGDGFALLRQLKNRGFNLPMFVVKLYDEKKFTPDTALNFKMLPESVVILNLSDAENLCGNVLFVDGMIGTGLSRNLSEKYLRAVNFINHYSSKKVLAIDVPSGLNSDNGKTMPLSVVADKTVSMGILKTGLFLNYGIEVSGEIVLGNISAHQKSFELIKDFVAQKKDFSFRQSKLSEYKNKHGHLLVFAGDLTKIGAAIICAKSFLASGGGLVTIALKKEFLPFFAGKYPEIMLESVENVKNRVDDFNVVVAGPGILNPDKKMIEFLEIFDRNIVLDAGMIDFIAKNDSFFKKMKKKNVVFTPHFGELRRFFKENGLNTEDFLEMIENFPLGENQILFAKNSASFIRYDAEICLIPHGAKALAFGGTGDSLTGILASMICREENLFKASIDAGLLHREAGLELEKEFGADFHNMEFLIKSISVAMKNLREEKND